MTSELTIAVDRPPRVEAPGPFHRARPESGRVGRAPLVRRPGRHGLREELPP